MNTICVVTGNKAKALEIAAITGFDVQPVNLNILEIQSLDVEEVARVKALAAYSQLQKPVIVDDTGMNIEALNGLPGALVSWFLDKLGPEGVLKLIGDNANRLATVSTCIGYADENGARTFVGVVSGSISSELRGSNGFGYDPIFVPDGETRTYAEMSSEEKNDGSMRKLALLKLKKFLESA